MAASTTRTAKKNALRAKKGTRRAAKTTSAGAKRATRGAKKVGRSAARKPARTAKKTTARARGSKPVSKRGGGAPQADAIALLKEDHRDVKELFRRYRGLGAGATRRKAQTMERVVRELSVHAAVEEQVFYPDVKAEVRGTKRLVDHALHEHQELKENLAKVQRLEPGSEEFEATMRTIIDDVTEHVKEEETELFPKVRQAKSKRELLDMAKMMRTAKKAAPTRPHPKAPSTPPGNIIVGAASAALDRARDAVRGAVGSG
jgi:hemerythrin superfamily protein